jgi:FG-GAP-like repeat
MRSTWLGNRVILYVAIVISSILFAALAANATPSNAPVFLAPVTYSSGGKVPLSVAVVDLNHDGKPDLALANYCSGNSNCTNLTPGEVAVLLGNGDGTFQPAVTYASGGVVAWSIAVADVNGDGNPDLFVTNIFGYIPSGHSTVGVLLGNGDGTFQPAIISDSGGFPGQSIAVADVNDDGKLDVVVGHCDISGNCFTGSGNVAVLLGNGDGTFQPAVLYGSGGQDADAVAIADVNGDGKLDILAANCGVANVNDMGPCPIHAVVGVLFGRGDGTFDSAVPYNSMFAARWLAVADVNGDQKPDILVAAQCGFANCDNNGEGGVAVLVNNGDGTFQSTVMYASGAYEANSVAVADVNGDSKPDLLVANELVECCTSIFGRASVLLGNGDATFQPPITYDLPGGSAEAVAVADVNADGKPDLLLATGDSVSVLLNNTPFETNPPVIVISATPRILWPPNGRLVPVTVSGTITDSGSEVNATTATYAVKDEYGLVQPSGAISLGPGGTYSFVILLQASRRGSDLNGRHYKITVRAKDNAGNVGSKIAIVIVPHRHPGL